MYFIDRIFPRVKMEIIEIMREKSSPNPRIAEYFL
jgi:hypothetical protein